MEYKGQMLEACWDARYRNIDIEDGVNSAAKTLRLYYSQFDGVPIKKIRKGLWKQEKWANKWLNDNAMFVARKAKEIGMDENDIDLILEYESTH